MYIILSGMRPFVYLTEEYQVRWGMKIAVNGKSGGTAFSPSVTTTANRSNVHE